MISGNMIKPSYHDAIAEWVNSGNSITEINGFTQKTHKPITPCKSKTRPRQEPLVRLSGQNADKLHHWLIVENGRLTALANYLGVSKTNVAMIRDRKTHCVLSKWRNIVKFMDSYKAC